MAPGILRTSLIDFVTKMRELGMSNLPSTLISLHMARISDPTLTRREFMKLAAVGASTVGFIAGCNPPPPSGRLFLEDNEASLLEAIAEQIIPTDDWPGGRDAGVATFIDRQLAGPYRRFQQDYRNGLAGITAICQRRSRKRFEELSWDEQTSFLQEMEFGKLDEGPWKDGFGKRFFEMLRRHSLQGYYGSPRHGGNRNYVSYKMIGLDYPQILGQNRYRS
jgi:gluconate 2-dehydrogenase gamma chain